MTDEHAFTCERDGVPTRLRCANCNLPICPACFVRTEVGLRCPTCGSAPPGLGPEPRRRPVPTVALLGAIVLVMGVLTVVARRESSPPAGVVEQPRTQVLEFEPPPPTQLPPLSIPQVPRDPADVFRRIDRSDLGLSVSIPPEWEVQPTDPAGGVFLATSRGAPVIWLRILVYPGGDGVAPTAQRVTAELLAGRQGVQQVVSAPTIVATRPSWLVRFNAPLNADGTGQMTAQTYYFLPVDSGIAALAFGTVELPPHAALVQLIASTVRFR